jgi:hypothetical protein
LSKQFVFARPLEGSVDDIRVGVLDAIEMVFGYNWFGPVSAAPPQRIAQVFTSTLAAGGYGRVSPSEAEAHAIMIGGGVFGSPLPIIWVDPVGGRLHATAAAQRTCASS